MCDVEDFYCTSHQDIHSISSRKILKVTLEINNQTIEFYSCHMNLPTCEDENIRENLYNLVNHTDDSNLKNLLWVILIQIYFNQKKDYNMIIEMGLFDTYEMAQKKDDGVTVYKKH